MGGVLKKLQFKDQRSVLVMNLPEDASFIMEEFEGLRPIKIKPGRADLFDLIFVFAKNSQDVSKFTGMISTHIAEDALLWFAYPKKTSKLYVSDINRDEGWNHLGALGFEAVRQVSITEDWSAIRFRHIKYIKQLTRSKLEALSDEGKKRAGSREKK